MGWIIIDFKRREEKSELKKLVPNIGKRMDQWLRNFENDGTPPNEDEAKELEDEQISSLMAAFDEECQVYRRVQDKYQERRGQLQRKLNERKGRLFARFSDQVDALEHAAANMMMFCMATFAEFEEDIEDELPAKDGEIDINFDIFIDSCEEYINTMYPGGVEGMDEYDDEFPEGLMPFSEFKAMVTEKQAYYIEKNQEAIASGIEQVKEDTREMAKNQINEAIKSAMAAIELDLSDDVLPYLDEDAMEELRAELISTSNEYGNSRLEE